jgi:hypothetical protein
MSRTRLIVRRVRPTPRVAAALDAVFSYHAVMTDRDGALLEVEANHRRHAIVEHTICDLMIRLPGTRVAPSSP